MNVNRRTVQVRIVATIKAYMVVDIRLQVVIEVKANGIGPYAAMDTGTLANMRPSAVPYVGDAAFSP